MSGHQAVNINHVCICRCLAAILNKNFKAICNRISETVIDRAKVAIDH